MAEKNVLVIYNDYDQQSGEEIEFAQIIGDGSFKSSLKMKFPDLKISQRIIPKNNLEKELKNTGFDYFSVIIFFEYYDDALSFFKKHSRDKLKSFTIHNEKCLGGEGINPLFLYKTKTGEPETSDYWYWLEQIAMLILGEEEYSKIIERIDEEEDGGD